MPKYSKRKRTLSASGDESERLERERRHLLRKLDFLEQKRRMRVYSSTSDEENECGSPPPPQEVEVDVHNNRDIASENEPVITVVGDNPEIAEVNPNITRFFGEEPVGSEPIWGPEVEPIMASHWTKYVELGIDKSEKEELQKKYPVPKNIPFLKSPRLNPEIMACLNDGQRKEDKYMSTIQGQIGNGLSALAFGLHKLLQADENMKAGELKQQIIPYLVDAGKIQADVFHMQSTNRKYRIEPHMNSTVRKIVKESKSDRFLCGENFSEKFKDAKSHLRTGKELKVTASTSSYSSQRRYSTPAGFTLGARATRDNSSNGPTGSLNYRGRLNKFRLRNAPPRYPRTTDKSKYRK